MSATEAFEVHLDVFSGPFDLLLGLIAKHRLDVTEVALSQVTDEFIAFMRDRDGSFQLETASEFLVVAATLLDLKAARLLPRGEVEDEEDVARLEARDLLFARLLAYRAFKEAAGWLDDRLTGEGRRFPRSVSLEPAYVGLLPEVVLGVGPEVFAGLAVRALRPRSTPTVDVEHMHAARVDMAAQQADLMDRLRRAGVAPFTVLCAGCDSTPEVVARFLVLLDLYREGMVSFQQADPLGELVVRWRDPADG
jgi:segregation and condensation protein A